jgi:hypothetical protein
MNEHTRRGNRAPHDELNEIADNIEQEIGQAVQNRPRDNGRSLDDISRASAEAMMMQYEAAAKEVEIMGAATKGRIGKIMAALDQEIEETAAVIRERGRVAQKLAEDVGTLARSVRDTCFDVRRKVGG